MVVEVDDAPPPIFVAGVEGPRGMLPLLAVGIEEGSRDRLREGVPNRRVGLVDLERTGWGVDPESSTMTRRAGVAGFVAVEAT